MFENPWISIGIFAAVVYFAYRAYSRQYGGDNGYHQQQGGMRPPGPMGGMFGGQQGGMRPPGPMGQGQRPPTGPGPMGPGQRPTAGPGQRPPMGPGF